MSELLEVDDLRVEFGAMTAVAGVSFRVEPGETYAIVGESGSGKTTLIRAVAGLLPSHAGSVRFQGRELRGMSARAFRPLRRHMAMTFQDPVGSLSPRLTVRSILTEPYRIQGIRKRDLDAEARRLLKLVGLTEEFGGRYPYQLSGGQAC
ncbi:MAG: ATP-binding cassette domain-containing protein, partial [Chloroflexi bacterium]|nr:ATP-binding cassette domain-containing protein [Chloroflexota bacterium]